VFEKLEKPELKALPVEVFQISQWRKAKINIDYHLEVDGHYYSVPYKFARLQVDVRLRAMTVEIFSNQQRIATHARALPVPSRKGRHTTVAEHMPNATQARQVPFLGSRSASTLQPVESRTLDCLGRENGFVHRQCRQSNPRVQTTSGAGLPILFGVDAFGENLW
jgi:hypothetical protein